MVADRARRVGFDLRSNLGKIDAHRFLDLKSTPYDDIDGDGRYGWLASATLHRSELLKRRETQNSLGRLLRELSPNQRPWNLSNDDGAAEAIPIPETGRKLQHQAIPIFVFREPVDACKDAVS